MKYMINFFLVFILSFSAIADEDPFEEVNRGVYDFNETIDDNLLEPVSRAYKDHVPEVAQDGVSNFFGNLRLQLWLNQNCHQIETQRCTEPDSLVRI